MVRSLELGRHRHPNTLRRPRMRANA
jgi:hypothetical protein